MPTWGAVHIGTGRGYPFPGGLPDGRTCLWSYQRPPFLVHEESQSTVKILYDTTEALKSPLPSKSKLSHRGPPPSGAVATTKTRREGRDGYHRTFVHTHRMYATRSEHKPGALGDYDVSVQVHWVEPTSHSGEGC